MIFAHSRYENTTRLFVDGGNGEEPIYRRVVEFPRFYATTFTARKHIIEEGDRFDLLAWRYYGEPEMWWMIAVANPELFYPEDLEAGTIVRIPSAPALL